MTQQRTRRSKVVDAIIETSFFISDTASISKLHGTFTVKSHYFKAQSKKFTNNEIFVNIFSFIQANTKLPNHDTNIIELY